MSHAEEAGGGEGHAHQPCSTSRCQRGEKAKGVRWGRGLYLTLTDWPTLPTALWS